MSVARTLNAALDGSAAGAEAIAEARMWLKRNESFLDWAARNPRLVQVNAEAAHLLRRLRGEDTQA